MHSSELNAVASEHSGIVNQGIVFADVIEDLREDVFRESHLGDFFLSKRIIRTKRYAKGW